VHIDASNFALGVMLGQNLDNTIDRPIYNANRLMNDAKIYTTTEKEALAMIYVVKKFRHYLLENDFILFCRSSSIIISSEQIDNNRLNC
jgi:hypothetical protein